MNKYEYFDNRRRTTAKAIYDLVSHYGYVQERRSLFGGFVCGFDALLKLRTYTHTISDLIDNYDTDAIINLASHYQNVEKNHEFMMILSSIAISKGILNKIIV
jgi:hypothetical protein